MRCVLYLQPDRTTDRDNAEQQPELAHQPYRAGKADADADGQAAVDDNDAAAAPVLGRRL